MRLVKYQALKDDQANNLKKGDLIENINIFSRHLQERYKDLEYGFIKATVRVIAECICGETREVDSRIRQEDGYINIKSDNVKNSIYIHEKEAELLPIELEKMSKWRTLDPALNLAEIEEKDSSYEVLLSLYGYGKSPSECNISWFVPEDFNEEFLKSEEGRKLASEVTGQIFDIIRESTERSLRGEFSKEETELYHSNDPKDKVVRHILRAKLMRHANAKSDITGGDVEQSIEPSTGKRNIYGERIGGEAVTREQSSIKVKIGWGNFKGQDQSHVGRLNEKDKVDIAEIGMVLSRR